MKTTIASLDDAKNNQLTEMVKNPALLTILTVGPALNVRTLQRIRDGAKRANLPDLVAKCETEIKQ